MFLQGIRGFSVLVLLAVRLCSRAWAGGEDWMKSIDGEKYLYDLTIPGTHDSGAMVEHWPGSARCQDKTIGEQLDFGIRFLDIRCRRVNERFVIHHGEVYQNMNFDDVMNGLRLWLRSHPSETVIMSLKEEMGDKPENSKRSFGKIFSFYVDKYDSRIWYLGNEVPQLKDVRGKIVLLRRFNDGDIEDVAKRRGLNADNRGWPDDDIGFLKKGDEKEPGPDIYVQDMHKVFWWPNKKELIINTLDQAKTTNPKILYLNFASCHAWADPMIPGMAYQANQALTEYFKDPNNGKGRYGVVIMDFANAERTKLIYEKNVTSDSAASSVP